MMSESERRRIMPLAMRAALFSVAMACFLLVLKGFAAWHTGSVAMLGSLADTGLDLLASLVTLYGVKLAAEPADHDHRFGHGKAEALAALFQVALITASGVGIAWRAIVAFGNPVRTQDADLGIGVSVVAIGATILLLTHWTGSPSTWSRRAASSPSLGWRSLGSSATSGTPSPLGASLTRRSDRMIASS